MSLRDTPLNEREKRVVRLRDEEKLTFQKIGDRLGVSDCRVAQIYHAAQHKIQFPPNGLSKKINRLLAKAGFIIEKEAIIHALQTGRLYPHCCPPNYGKYAHRDVCRWAGVDPATLPHEWPDRDWTPYPDDGLSYRAHNLLRYAGIPATKASVLEALNTGQLSPGKRPCGYGKITHVELCRWAGVNSATLAPALPKHTPSRLRKK